MFDISLGEMMVCLVVILIVIGPERLPETVRTIALWVGRLKRSIRETRSEIERHIGADDIRRQLYNEEIMRNLEKTRAEMNQGLNSLEQNIKNPLSDLSEEQRTALYRAPEELPDHAHLSEASASAVQPPESTPTPDNTTKV